MELLALLTMLGRRVAFQVVLHMIDDTSIILMLSSTTAPLSNYVTTATWAIVWLMHWYEQCEAWSVRKMGDEDSFHQVKVEDNQELYV